MLNFVISDGRLHKFKGKDQLFVALINIWPLK